jgi:hypothetical protein
MDFKGRNPVRSKIVTNNNIIEKINTVNYPRCSIHARMLKILLLGKKNFLQMTGMIYRILKPPKFQQHTKPKIYTKLALPTLLYGWETWEIREEDKNRITSAGIKFMRRMAKYT